MSENVYSIIETGISREEVISRCTEAEFYDVTKPGCFPHNSVMEELVSNGYTVFVYAGIREYISKDGIIFDCII